MYWLKIFTSAEAYVEVHLRRGAMRLLQLHGRGDFYLPPQEDIASIIVLNTSTEQMMAYFYDNGHSMLVGVRALFVWRNPSL